MVVFHLSPPRGNSMGVTRFEIVAVVRAVAGEGSVDASDACIKRMYQTPASRLRGYEFAVVPGQSAARPQLASRGCNAWISWRCTTAQQHGPQRGTASVAMELGKRIHNSRPTLGSSVDTAQRSLHTGAVMGGHEAVGALLNAVKGGFRW